MSDDSDRPASDVSPVMRASLKLWADYHADRAGPTLAEVMAQQRRQRDERNTYRGGEALRRRRRKAP